MEITKCELRMDKHDQNSRAKHSFFLSFILFFFHRKKHRKNELNRQGIPYFLSLASNLKYGLELMKPEGLANFDTKGSITLLVN